MPIPKVTIGLPVHNGDRYLREAIDSVLQQQFDDFELILSDNASTDQTRIIGKSYANQDSRVRYVRHDVNRGAAWNFNYVVSRGQGLYFKWMAHDDLCHPGLLSQCVRVLDGQPDVVLCCGKTAQIDAQGKFMRNRDFRLALSHYRPDRRYSDLICVNHSCFEIFGLLRMESLRRYGDPIGPYVGSDRTLLARLSLQGRMVRLPRVLLLLHREHPGRSTRVLTSLQQRIAWFDPKRAKCLTYPHWRLLQEYARAIWLVQLPWQQVLRCHLHLVRWLRIHLPLLLRDVHYAFMWLCCRGASPPAWNAPLPQAKQ